jgi:hypothetical protein
VAPDRASAFHGVVYDSGGKAEVGTVDEVTIREAEIRVDQDSVQASPSVLALETEHLYAMRWGVASVEEFRGRALIECLEDDGSRGLYLLGDSISWHLVERGVRRRSKRQGVAQGCCGTESATETHRRRDRALCGKWWAQSEER